MGVIQLVIRPVEPAPPGAKPARVVPQRVVGVEHDPVHTVIGAGQKIPVPLAELIDHARTVTAAPTATDTAPKGPLMLGEVPRSA
jgi:hypothetical protein